ncbi:septum site-determining protein Ssd [Arthrobacter sp. TMS1-12-1]
MTQQTWTPEGRRRAVVLAGGSQYVQDQVARACAAAGVSPHFAVDLARALPLEPTVLLLGAEQSADGLPGHRDVIVVGAADDESRAWAAAANLASSRVVILPQGAGWLAEHLGRRLNPAASGAVVGFLGAAGGAGVSTFAFWCARHAAGLGTSTLLVDGHPLGGGLDLALGIEDHPGVRWDDLRDLRGTLNAEQLAAALPGTGRLAVLSHAARPETADGHPGHGMESVGAVLDAARGAYDLSVVDLGSAGSSTIHSLVPMCDQLVLLVPSRPRSAAAVTRILEAYSSLPTTVVLRGPVLDGLDAWVVADLAGRPGPLPYLPFVRGSSVAEASGRMLDFPLPRRARKLVGSVVAGLERAA